MRETGRIKYFDLDRGYGIIIRDKKIKPKAAMFHVTNIKYYPVYEGDTVSFKIGRRKQNAYTARALFVLPHSSLSEPA